ncbi:MAG: hypothetical protein LIO99_10840 [Clostridiales bacterium]|nr:hypothetical protein [Clostridiales bacterium]
MNKKQSFCMTILFCVLIFGFGAVTLITPDTDYSETENRTLAQMPSFSLETLLDGSFEADYEEYLTDQFVYRDGWIALKTGVERAALRTQINDIYFAKEDYLIEAHTGTFIADQAAENIEILSQFVGNYADRFGAEHMTVMIIPNAVDILRDKLPAFASPYDEEEYLSEIKASVSGSTAAADGTVWFDAGEVLQKHSDEEIYYRTDHHWTTLGAFYVYQAWAEACGYVIPDLDTYEIETVTEEFEGTIQSKLGIHTVMDSIKLFQNPDMPSYTVENVGTGESSDSLYDYGALEAKSKYDIFLGGNNALTRITTDAGTGRKLLLIKDSYAHCFVPFMLSEFDQIDVLDIRYFNQELSALIEEEGYTDLLFLYNASGFAEDTSLAKLLY